MGNRVYVGNLSFQTTEDSLRAVVTPHGEPTEVKIVTDRDSGQSRGFAFVTMANEHTAKQLIGKLDGSMLDGRALRVNEAEDRRGGMSGGGGGGGYGGGGGGGGRGGGGGGGFRSDRR